MGKLGDELDRNLHGPMLFLEYAAGHGLDWFVEMAERLRDVPSVGVCVDVGHVGITQARASFAHAHPGLEDVAGIESTDARLPELELTRSLGRIGRRFHLHLHDGHPLIPGLSDHLSFLTRVPVPFDYRGRRSLDPLYGPAGLSAIVWAAAQAGGASLTLEIHQAAAPSVTPPACSSTGGTSPMPSG